MFSKNTILVIYCGLVFLIDGLIIVSETTDALDIVYSLYK